MRNFTHWSYRAYLLYQRDVPYRGKIRVYVLSKLNWKHFLIGRDYEAKRGDMKHYIK